MSPSDNHTPTLGSWLAVQQGVQEPVSVSLKQRDPRKY